MKSLTLVLYLFLLYACDQSPSLSPTTSWDNHFPGTTTPSIEGVDSAEDVEMEGDSLISEEDSEEDVEMEGDSLTSEEDVEMEGDSLTSEEDVEMEGGFPLQVTFTLTDPGSNNPCLSVVGQLVLPGAKPFTGSGSHYPEPGCTCRLGSYEGCACKGTEIGGPDYAFESIKGIPVGFAEDWIKNTEEPPLENRSVYTATIWHPTPPTGLTKVAATLDLIDGMTVLNYPLPTLQINIVCKGNTQSLVLKPDFTNYYGQSLFWVTFAVQYPQCEIAPIDIVLYTL